MSTSIVFWQRMLTPHMTELARELAKAGSIVHYVTEQTISKERLALGWQADALPELRVHYIGTLQEARNVFDQLPYEAVHITQGVRSNGLISSAQHHIALRRLRHYVIMEKVDLRGLARLPKTILYYRAFRTIATYTRAVLAIGDGTSEWITRIAPPSLQAVPFAYFLKAGRSSAVTSPNCMSRFIFVGNLIRRKRVDLLVRALSQLQAAPFQLEIVGDGPERHSIQCLGNSLIPGRMSLKGTLPMQEATERLSLADCLVLPSDHDGWGAVVSEAQIRGTPAICSSECGSAGTARLSGFGSTFKAGDIDSLRACLQQQLTRGPITNSDREALRSWAKCLTAPAGATYLLEIMCSQSDRVPPAPPWVRMR